MPSTPEREVSGESNITFEAGNISRHIENWQKLTNDKFILNMVLGSEIPIEDLEVLSKFRPIPKNDIPKESIPFIEKEVLKLLKSKVIEKSYHEEQEIVSPIFAVPKSDGSFRIILNLKKFNQHVEYEHFKMENAVTAMRMMRKNCFMASVDLRSAYYSVPIKKSFRKYLKFYWKGQFFQYTCFPNGLSNCPRYFTKLMKPVYAFLRSKGHLSTAFIDDSFLQAQSFKECLRNVEDTISIFKALGFVVHNEKSVLTPSKEIKYLGFLFNSVTMTVRLTKEKADKVKTACTSLYGMDKNEMCSIRKLAQVIGLLVASFQAVLGGPLHYRQLENVKSIALRKHKGNFDAYTKITEKAREELNWWIQNVNDSYFPLEMSKPEIELKTDASSSGGWGAYCESIEAGGRWTREEKEFNINCLELLAIEYALKSFKFKVIGKHVKVLTDNTCAVSYLRNMGGSKSMQCNEIANRIWSWCLEEKIWLTVTHIPGKINIEADRKSRQFDDHTEWQLSPDIFQQIQRKIDFPQIDLFASRLNYQMKPYVSWGPDPEACAIDAFTLSWHMLSYAFPPFCLIQRILSKVEQEEAEMILIAPLWTTAVWFPQLLRLLTRDPVLLPRRRNLLQLTHSSEPHPLHRRLQLIAARISGDQSKQRVFREGLMKLSAHRGETLLRSNMMSTLRSGSDFVIENRLIHCVPL